MIRRPPRSTLDRSSAASDVYKRQSFTFCATAEVVALLGATPVFVDVDAATFNMGVDSVSYTHLRAHETVLDLVCRLLLEKKKTKQYYTPTNYTKR